MKTKKNYYKFSPYETNQLLEASGEDRVKVLDLAIDAARERERIYHMPCQWTAKFVKDGTIVVIKEHY